MDLAVVGAGAAGLLTAISALREKPGLSVTVFDTRKKVGAKILISGGTRCNVTNVSVKPSDYRGGPSHFVKHVLEAFTPEATRRFFEEIGVHLVLEPTGKYFPVTNSGRTVLDALLKELARRGGKLAAPARVTGAEKTPGGFFRLRADTESGAEFLEARRVALCTGGLSYPETGSDGTGYVLARSLGHTLTPTWPALTPLLTDDAGWRALSGVTLDARLSFYRGGKKERTCEGSFLFTHEGFSGPAALDVSRHAADPAGGKWEIRAAFAPRAKPESAAGALAAEGAKKLKNAFADAFGLPVRFAETLLGKAGFDPEASAAKLKPRDRARAVHALFDWPLPVTGVTGYKKAEVTAGGVPLSEVSVSTMESKKTPGLHFAGEILDCEGRIGGFNFQWAWSTGTVAGRAAARALA